ncbi:MAG: hypothetical protein KA941_01270 [Flavobacteriales bacterium]|nr:hypothetical protein [Flavobacteriales bacterium]
MQKFLLHLVLCVTVCACAGSNQVITKGPIQKRKYRPGWSIDWPSRTPPKHDRMVLRRMNAKWPVASPLLTLSQPAPLTAARMPETMSTKAAHLPELLPKKEVVLRSYRPAPSTLEHAQKVEKTGESDRGKNGILIVAALLVAVALISTSQASALLAAGLCIVAFFTSLAAFLFSRKRSEAVMLLSAFMVLISGLLSVIAIIRLTQENQ